MQIACVLADGFEDSEMRIPFDALVRAGHDVVIVGGARGEEVAGMKGHEKVKIDLGIEDAKNQRFDGPTRCVPTLASSTSSAPSTKRARRSLRCVMARSC